VILVPVKNLGQAKQRLAPLLDPGRRTALAEAMLADVLLSIRRSSRHRAVGVVTQDSFAARLALEHGFEVIPELANRGETYAIEQATEYSRSRGADHTLVLPADIPLITPGELDEIFASAPASGTVLVPASDGRGTNAVLRSPPALFPLHFGNDSFVPHLEAARATGQPCTVLDLPGIGLDIDQAADLGRLSAAEGDTLSQKLVRSWDLGEPSLAASR
jgi:2-phospho-L-lactate guanylyltransferase